MWQGRRNINELVTTAVTAAFLTQDGSGLSKHMQDCAEFRRNNNERLIRIEDSQRSVNSKIDQIDERIKEATKDRQEQHRENLGSLRWQRGLLITILLAIFAFVGVQLWNQAFHIQEVHAPIEGPHVRSR